MEELRSLEPVHPRTDGSETTGLYNWNTVENMRETNKQTNKTIHGRSINVADYILSSEIKAKK